jgi:hypothetical protein
MKELFKALASFQQEVPVIHEETNSYNYTYANINTVLKVITPLLDKHGLGFTQFLNGDSLNTYVFHIESGEKIESSIKIPEDVTLKGQNKFQILGSGITYLRRYSLACLLGLITDKDIDASGTEVKPKVVKTLSAERFKKMLELSDEEIKKSLSKVTLSEEQKNTVNLKLKIK